MKLKWLIDSNRLKIHYYFPESKLCSLNFAAAERWFRNWVSHRRLLWCTWTDAFLFFSFFLINHFTFIFVAVVPVGSGIKDKSLSFSAKSFHIFTSFSTYSNIDLIERKKIINTSCEVAKWSLHNNMTALHSCGCQLNYTLFCCTSFQHSLCTSSHFARFAVNGQEVAINTGMRNIHVHKSSSSSHNSQKNDPSCGKGNHQLD